MRAGTDFTPTNLRIAARRAKSVPRKTPRRAAVPKKKRAAAAGGREKP